MSIEKIEVFENKIKILEAASKKKGANKKQIAESIEKFKAIIADLKGVGVEAESSEEE